MIGNAARAVFTDVPDSSRIAVITGTTRPGRFSEKPAAWIADVLRQREGVDVTALDLRDYPMPFYDEPASPAMITPEDYGNETAKRWAAQIAEHDGFVIVTGEYNHGYPAVLKNALDYVYHAWNGKAVGFVSYGSVGGGRAVEQLRQVAVELQMAPIRSSVHIPADIHFPVLFGKAEWKPMENEKLMGDAATMLDQLLWWTRVLKREREEAM